METNIKSGLAFHMHHDRLAEWCYDYDKRVRQIKRSKPVEEQELRLRLFQLIPEDRLPAELVKAGEAYTEAWKAYDEAWKAYTEAWKAYTEARKAYDEAEKPYNKTQEAYVKAVKATEKAYDKAGKAYIEARERYDKVEKGYHKKLKLLHQELCPDCPWDGKTIFGKKEGK